jgi:hypothetical protein
MYLIYNELLKSKSNMVLLLGVKKMFISEFKTNIKIQFHSILNFILKSNQQINLID